MPKTPSITDKYLFGDMWLDACVKKNYDDGMNKLNCFFNQSTNKYFYAWLMWLWFPLGCIRPAKIKFLHVFHFLETCKYFKVVYFA